MLSIKFLGASSGCVTGSSYLLENDGQQILIDLGLFQGSKEIADLNYKPLDFNPSKLKGVFLTHAHLDHCGRLPLLMQLGFFGKVFMTAPTRSLLELSLNDTVKIAEETPWKTKLYGYSEVNKLLKLIEIVEYDKQFEIANFLVTFKNAGHILGSASIEIKEKKGEKKIVFSGDIGNTPEDIIKPTQYIDSADYVVMEATYGDKNHKKENASLVLNQVINQTEDRSGVLLIPAFSLERTQELLHLIYHLKKENKIRRDTPFFLDSPMGIQATLIFKEFKEFYNSELLSHHDDPFSFEGLVITESVRDSKDIIKAITPKVIIAGSGMMSGGRILHHAINYLPSSKTALLFVGYQAEGTLGRKILEGAGHIQIDKEMVKVRAKIMELEALSSHADQAKLLTWARNIRGVNKFFLTHAENMQRESFANVLRRNNLKVYLPSLGETVALI